MSFTVISLVGMDFESLHRVLGALENQPAWHERQQFKRLLARWSEVVGPVVAQQTKPIAVQRGVLNVATSSAAWAQNLIFERQRIVEKLNAQLHLSLRDIRFSTAQWQGTRPKPNSAQLDVLGEGNPWQDHPCYFEPTQPSIRDRYPRSEIKPTPEDAFQQWAARMQQRSQHLPLCPRCACPTPPGELQRWSVCALCAPWQM